LLDAIVRTAYSARTNSGAGVSTIQALADAAARQEVSSFVQCYPVSSSVPTTDYNAFIASSDFQSCVAVAAAAAAEGAVDERAATSLYTLTSLQGAARAAAMTALQSVYAAAARAVRTALPLDGRFGPGLGDPRMTWEISQSNQVALGAAALTGTIYLPANHPTNPFRHRRHPDHSTGFDIRRTIRMDFNTTPSNTLVSAGYGVDKITGTYREEISGLHKPLGPQQNVGLKVEGTFELNRISLVDTLNAR
jgi:hypothetical protein